MVSLFKGYDAGYKGLIPPYIVLTEPQGRFSEAGFLGPRYKPFATGGDPAQNALRGRRRGQRQALPTSGRRGGASCCTSWTRWRMSCRPMRELAASAQCEKEAYDLILGDAGKVFDLAQEKDELRDRYGRNTFGQSCLVARRLVERGVPYITINYGGWDTHKDNFQAMRRQLPEMDKGMAALLQDLSRPRLAGPDHRVVGRRVRPNAKNHVGSAVERRARPLGQCLLRRGRRRRIQGRPSSSARRTPKARK